MGTSYYDNLKDVIDYGGHVIINCPPQNLINIILDKFNGSLISSEEDSLSKGSFKYEFDINNKLYRYEGNWKNNGYYRFEDIDT